MTDKLLAKPPFRFLHDTISALLATSGFGQGLFSGQELDSAAIAEKQDKINYLEKIFLFVSICKGAPIDVRAAKVVAGLEPENTNMFLLALVDCVTDQNLDSEEAVRRTLANESPSAPPYRRSKAESKGGGDPSGRSGAKSSQPLPSHESESKGGGGGGNMDFKGIDMDIPAAIAQQGGSGERGKSRGGTRGGRPNQATADVGLRGFGSNAVPNLDAYIESCDGSEDKTQEFLGELITRPKLTPKLLSKPPVRFLHDIVMEVIRTTGFGAGLYNDDEMDSAKMSEKAQKLTFLEKIIKLVGIQLNTLVEAKPVRIIAGMDPQATNTFLQLLAVAAKYMPDSMAAVRTVLELESGSDIPASSSSSATAAPPVAAAAAASIQQHHPPSEEKPSRAKQAEAPPQQPPQMSSMAEAKERDSPFPNQNNAAQANEERREIDDKLTTEDAPEGDPESKRNARPTTARRRPPKVVEAAKEVTAKEAAPVVKKAEGILIEGQGDDDDEEIIPDEARLADEMKAEEKNASNAADSKLVKGILSRQAEQEAARKAQMAEESKSPVVDPATEAGKNNPAGGSGIRLGRRAKAGGDKKGAGTGAGLLGESDMERLRSAIQVLVQHTGPLGTCMDFIQEDIGLMSTELHRWEEECRRYEAEAEEERRRTKAQLQPLQAELSDLVEQINEKAAVISATKASIAKNDDKIQQMLKLMTTA